MAALVVAHAAKNQQIDAELDRLRRDAALARSKAAARTDKIERQARIIANLTYELVDARAKVDWLSRVGLAIAEFPRWWSLLPTTVMRRWQDRRLRDGGLFDASRYRADHPADAEAQSAPLRHCLLKGAAEQQMGDSKSP